MSEIRKLTCIECPVGCDISVELDGDKVLEISGNGCARGKMYAGNEVVCPRRVITTTVRTESGRVLPVKTDKPVKKSEIFSVMKKIDEIVAKGEIREGQIVAANISEDINLIATDDLSKSGL